ncbi:hypothetical protein MUK42_23637 [Musa troglodytarum]|uniref:Uncharacterized protein n=1 Tax=Musa troglodytarum TaxID=320322 RepID=A0A9E7GH60_9LILI|nr:hypothetical protein MUK42_23637 [Musa troglodytarum]
MRTNQSTLNENKPNQCPHLKCRSQPPLLSSHAATKELENQNDGLAVDRIAMENSSRSKVSPRYSTKYTVQSYIPVVNHSSEDKSLEMIDKTLMDKMNNQDVSLLYSAIYATSFSGLTPE